jgi:superoxide dismutase
VHNLLRIKYKPLAYILGVNIFMNFNYVPLDNIITIPLPNSYDALEPFISQRTMRMHHDKITKPSRRLKQAEINLSDARKKETIIYKVLGKGIGL